MLSTLLLNRPQPVVPQYRETRATPLEELCDYLGTDAQTLHDMDAAYENGYSQTLHKIIKEQT